MMLFTHLLRQIGDMLPNEALAVWMEEDRKAVRVPKSDQVRFPREILHVHHMENGYLFFGRS